MRQWIQGLRMAFLAAVCAGAVLTAQAQEPPLEKKVKAEYEHERLDAVLNDLAKKGKIRFAYKSDIIKKDRMVTLTLPETTLQEVLEAILGDGFDVVGEDDYVIIRPRAAVARKAMEATKARKTMQARKQTVYNIIDQMVADGLVRDKDSFSWFALDNGQFQVDGKPMADSLRVKYAAKFIGPDGDGYYYGPVAVHGRGFFFDKKELYGSPR